MNLPLHLTRSHVFIGLAVVAIFCTLLVLKFTQAQRSPFLSQMDRMREISQKVAYYAEEHSGVAHTSSLDALVTAGALSPTDVTYIRTNGIRFHGVGTNTAIRTPMFEATYSSRDLRRLIVSYSDGTVESHSLATAP